MERGHTSLLRRLAGWRIAGVALVALQTAAPLNAQSRFRRGDVNCNGFVSAVDGYELGQSLFVPGYTLPCSCDDALDANDTGSFDAADMVFILSYTLIGGTPPPAPGPLRCGADPTADPLGCPGYPPTACDASPTNVVYKRGDINGDGCVNVADALMLQPILSGTISPPFNCRDAADANGDLSINLADMVFLLAFCRTGGPPPPAPGPYQCGTTSGGLGCAAYPLTACATGCPNMVPGDCNGDGVVDIGDPICLLGHLFNGRPARLPCGDGAAAHPSNIRLLSWRGQRSVDLSDAIAALGWLFSGGPPHHLGRSCVWIEACPSICPGC